MIQALEVAMIKELKMTCADGEVQICYLIIAKFIINYEEQVVITNIKLNLG